jgi:hypothetical protein
MMKLTPEEIKELYRRTQNGEIGINGVVGGGVWWGGTYVDVLDTTILRNNTRQTPLMEFLRLGTGRCTEETESTTITLSIQGTRGSNYQNAIHSSFGFTASGTRTWTRTERYCGPNEPNMLRIFYQHGIYNEYEAVVVRL